VQHHAAAQLDVEGPLAKDAFRGFAHRRERFGQKTVKRSAFGEAGPEFVRFGPQGLVGKFDKIGLEGVDLVDYAVLRAKDAVVVGTE